MMMGYGSYGHGGSSPCSSNLSALAPPFTVTVTGPKPVTAPLLVDLNEPNYAATMNPTFHNWVSHGPHSPSPLPDYFSVPSSDFDPIPSSNAYGYSPSTAHVPLSNPLASASADGALYGQSSIGLVEAEPYYPSYVSPALGDGSPLVVPHQSGYDLLSAPHVPATNGPSHEDFVQNFSGLEHMNHWSGGSCLWEGPIDWQQSKPLKLDESYCSNGSYTNQGISKYEAASHIIDMVGMETGMESGSAGKLDYKTFPNETLKFIPSTYSATSASASSEVTPDTYPQVPSLRADISRNWKIPYGTSYDICSRRQDGCPNDSTPVIRSSPAVVIRAPVQGSCSFKNINDGHDKDFAGNNYSVIKEPQPFKGSEGVVRFELSQLSSYLEQNDHIEEFPRSKNTAEDSLQQIFRATGEMKSPQTNIDCSNLAGCSSEANNAVENSSESLDHYNPSVDSPCWRGAPVSHWSQFDVVVPQNVKKLEAFSGMNDHDSQNFLLGFKDAIEFSPEKVSENSMPHHDRSLDHSLDSSFRKHPVSNMLFKEGTNGTVKSGQHPLKPRSFHGVQISDDIHDPKKDFIPTNKSIPNCNFEPPRGEQQSRNEGKWTSAKNSVPRVDVADDRKHINDEADGCSSHVPLHAIEHVLCSPPSGENALSKLAKSHSQGSMPKICARMLVNTMHNLSELLRFHCLNDACELKEEDCEVLMNVIKNLDTCRLKNVERKGPPQESFVPLSTNSLGRSLELHKDEEHHMSLVKDAGKGAADVLKEDKMTQAIKKLLTENFQDEEETMPETLLYKNLWLEAEASLCLVNSMARLNRMKTEMENCTVPNDNDLPENTGVMDSLSTSKVISDLFATSTVEAVNKSDLFPDSSVPDSSIHATSGHADDIMARLHILKSRVDNSSSVNAYAAEDPPGSKLSTGSQICKLADDEDIAKLENPIQDHSTYSAASLADDVEPSILARFHILLSRDDNSSSLDMEKHPAEGIDLGYNRLSKLSPISKHGLKDKVLDINMEPVLENSTFNPDEDESTVKEFHLFDDLMAQSRMPYGLADHPHAGWWDSSSSDWEHVVKEEFTGGNC